MKAATRKHSQFQCGQRGRFIISVVERQQWCKPPPPYQLSIVFTHLLLFSSCVFWYTLYQIFIDEESRQSVGRESNSHVKLTLSVLHLYPSVSVCLPLLFLSLPLLLSLSLFGSLPLFLYMYLSHPLFFLSVSLTVFFCLSFSSFLSFLFSLYFLSLFLSPSVPHSLPPFFSLSLSPTVSLSFRFSLILCFSIFFCLSLFLSVSLYRCLSLSPSFCLSNFMTSVAIHLICEVLNIIYFI